MASQTMTNGSGAADSEKVGCYCAKYMHVNKTHTHLLNKNIAITRQKCPNYCGVRLI